MYQQSSSYECGPYALKHALQMLGVFTDERRLGAIAGTCGAGTDEVQLGRAAARVGCDLPMVRATDPSGARRVLDAQLARGTPALLCVDQWDHWIAVVGGDENRYSVLDSADPAVVSVMPWPTLVTRWGYREPGAAGLQSTYYDVHPVVLRGKAPAGGALGADTAALLRQPHHRQLVRDWPVYSRALLSLAAAAAPGNGEPTAVALADLLAEQRHRLLDLAAGRRLARRLAAAAELERVRLVARTYGLRVLREKSRPVLLGVAELVRGLVG
jgi:hypothetical protein